MIIPAPKLSHCEGGKPETSPTLRKISLSSFPAPSLHRFGRRGFATAPRARPYTHPSLHFVFVFVLLRCGNFLKPGIYPFPSALCRFRFCKPQDEQHLHLSPPSFCRFARLRHAKFPNAKATLLSRCLVSAPLLRGR